MLLQFLAIPLLIITLFYFFGCAGLTEDHVVFVLFFGGVGEDGDSDVRVALDQINGEDHCHFKCFISNKIIT